MEAISHRQRCYSETLSVSGTIIGVSCHWRDSVQQYIEAVMVVLDGIAVGFAHHAASSGQARVVV